MLILRFFPVRSNHVSDDATALRSKRTTTSNIGLLKFQWLGPCCRPVSFGSKEGGGNEGNSICRGKGASLFPWSPYISNISLIAHHGPIQSGNVLGLGDSEAKDGPGEGPGDQSCQRRSWWWLAACHVLQVPFRFFASEACLNKQFAMHCHETCTGHMIHMRRCT